MKNRRLNNMLMIMMTLTSGFSSSQIRTSQKDSIMNHVESMLSNDWFVEESVSGFKVYFCRSCQAAYDEFRNGDYPFVKRRKDFFTLENCDSVSYYGTVSQRLMPFSDSIRDKFAREKYAATGIMSFEVMFEKTWSKERYDSVYQKNELLKSEILKQSLYKESINIFSDYRFWLPENYLRARTKKYDFYFQRLPYTSRTLDYSIFIIQDKTSFFTAPLYVDKKDPKYYDNHLNFLHEERAKALKIIASALGIYDFKIIS